MNTTKFFLVTADIVDADDIKSVLVIMYIPLFLIWFEFDKYNKPCCLPF